MSKEEDRIEESPRQIADDLRDGDLTSAQERLQTMPAAEISRTLDSLPPVERTLAWGLVEPDVGGEVLVHVNDEVRASLIERMDQSSLVAATADLDLDDLADILEDLPELVVQQVIEAMDREDRERLARVLSYPEDSAGGLMNPDVITVRNDVSLEVVQRYLRMREELPDLLDDLYVTDRDGKFLGRLPLFDLLTKDPKRRVSRLVATPDSAVPVDMPARDVARLFEDKDWTSAGVIDQGGHLLGRITIDDVVDFIRDEAEQSVLAMAGLDEEEDMFAPIIQSARRRALWLGVNLLTALLAAWFIGRFERTLDQIVALAILMPVIASMGGIAGTQTLTIMIRGMATGQIGRGNTRPLLSKELMVGMLNGLIWALVVSAVAIVWFQDSQLGFVAAAAIFINLLAAALAGVIVPLVLKRLDIDPALAGGVVLTTVTDVIGFVSFLGLGTLLLL